MADLTYGDGTLSGNQYTNRSDSTGVAASDQGTFTPGKHGTVTVTVPRQFVGNAKAGDILGSPTGQTFELVGTPQTGGLLEPVNHGGPQYDYQVGQVCNSPGRARGAVERPADSRRWCGHRRRVPRPPPPPPSRHRGRRLVAAMPVASATISAGAGPGRPGHLRKIP
jgi:hypothetical protein